MRLATTEKLKSDSLAPETAKNNLSNDQIASRAPADLKIDTPGDGIDDIHADDAAPDAIVGSGDNPALATDRLPANDIRDAAFDGSISSAPRVDPTSTTADGGISYQHPDTPVEISAKWDSEDVKFGVKIDVDETTSVDAGVTVPFLATGIKKLVELATDDADTEGPSSTPGAGGDADPDEDAPTHDGATTDPEDEEESGGLLDQFLDAIGLGDDDESSSSNNDETNGQTNASTNDNNDEGSSDDDNTETSDGDEDEDEADETTAADAGEEADDASDPPPEEDYDPETGGPIVVTAEQVDAAIDKMEGQKTWDVTPGWDDPSGDNPDGGTGFDVGGGKPYVDPRETVYDKRPDDIDYRDDISADDLKQKAIDGLGNLVQPTDDDADGVWGQPDNGTGPTDPFGGTDPAAAQFMYSDHEPLPQGIMGAPYLQQASFSSDSHIGSDPGAAHATEVHHDAWHDMLG